MYVKEPPLGGRYMPTGMIPEGPPGARRFHLRGKDTGWSYPEEYFKHKRHVWYEEASYQSKGGCTFIYYANTDENYRKVEVWQEGTKKKLLYVSYLGHLLSAIYPNGKAVCYHEESKYSNRRIKSRGRVGTNNLLQGRWELFHMRTGARAAVLRYKNGLLNGMCMGYYESGGPMFRVSMQQGEKEGFGYYWNIEGGLLGTRFYHKGFTVKEGGEGGANWPLGQTEKILRTSIAPWQP